MADLEKTDSRSSDRTTPSDTTLRSQKTPEGEKEFQSINSPSRVASRAGGGSRPTSLRSMSRIRSNNGYGCDDIEDEVVVGEGGAAVVDEWEVGWEGGESDPLNPRSMTMARKWIVVLIVSASSLCV